MLSSDIVTQDAVVLSLVVPMYNEEDMVDIFYDEITEAMSRIGVDYEIIIINDGSQDRTASKVTQICGNDDRVKLINLSRNFGKEIALTAGLDHVSGQAAIPLDCDLQDPPELISIMLDKWREGYDVVLAKRADRQTDTRMKRLTSALFYKLIGKLSDVKIPSNVGDFRLMDRKVLDALSHYPERSRFMKGLFASLGFSQTTVEYIRPKRAAGETKWNYWGLYKLALEGVISFTSFPLKIWSYLGITVAIASMIYGFILIIKTLVFGIDTPGYASLMVVLLFMSGLILICLGILGEYISRIFIEVKARPLYHISSSVGFMANDRDSIKSH